MVSLPIIFEQGRRLTHTKCAEKAALSSGNDLRFPHKRLLRPALINDN
jgi:hypothetical protein